MTTNKVWATIKQKLEERFAHKTIVLIGFGREGMSTYKLLQKLSIPYQLYVMDQDTSVVETYLSSVQDQTTIVLPAQAYLKDLDIYDIIFKTPGLPGFLLKDIDTRKILSQSELFMEYMGQYSIGITGTKGKSTTSSLIVHVLTQLGLSVKLVGNIGYPAFECLEEHVDGQLYVYEMSSFQTEFLQHGPHIRVILNLFEEHLNNYESYRAYQDAKLQLFLADHPEQMHSSLCIYGVDNDLLRERIGQMENDMTKSIQAFGKIENNIDCHPGVFLEDDYIWYRPELGDAVRYGHKDFHKELLGEHNLINSLVVINIIEYLTDKKVLDRYNMSHREILRYIGGFKGLDHRLEYVGTYEEITFYNDSISTIPEATIQAMRSIPHLMTLIIGGFDRGIDYVEFTKQLLKHPKLHVICLPNTGHKIYGWAEEINVEGVAKYWHQVETMDEAVILAYQITAGGQSCLLSPAASSYHRYKNFEERGDHFKQLVRKVANNNS